MTFSVQKSAGPWLYVELPEKLLVGCLAGSNAPILIYFALFLVALAHFFCTKTKGGSGAGTSGATMAIAW